MFANKLGLSSLFFVLLSVFGCVTNPKERLDASPVKAIAVSGQPEENVNDFSDILECVGRQVASYGTKRFVVGNDLIRNETGIKDGIPDSGRTLLQSSFAKLVENSNGKIIWMGFSSLINTPVHIDFVSSTPKEKKNNEALDFIIFGAITQFEKELQKANRDVGIKAAEYGGAGISDSAGLSVLATNLTLHSATSGYSSIYKGIQSNNIISVRNEDSNTGLNVGLVNLAGINFNVAMKKKEGVSAALMTLMQLGAIELTGKYYKDDFDYKLCLIPEKREAINRKLGWQNKYIENMSDLPQIEKPKFIIQVNAKEKLKAKDRIEFKAEASENGYLYCFYSMADGRMVRIFPNRYVTDNFLTQSVPVNVPGNNKLSISVDKGVTDHIDCIFSRVDVARIVTANSSLTPNKEFSFQIIKSQMDKYLSPDSFSIKSFDISAK